MNLFWDMLQYTIEYRIFGVILNCIKYEGNSFDSG
jgi:hypothetical protein